MVNLRPTPLVAALLLAWMAEDGPSPARAGQSLTAVSRAQDGMASVPAAPASPFPHRPDRILIRPKAGVDRGEWTRFQQTQNVTVLAEFAALGGLQVIQIPTGAQVNDWVRRYEQSGWVEFAEPDYLVHASATPNDPRFLDGTLWGLHNTGQAGGVPDADIDAPEAWELHASAHHIVAAVLDTGVRLTHEDLAANLWAHPADGTHGYNAIADNHDPTDDNGHGTLVAGLLGAVGNNGKGMVGVAWQVRLMALKCLDGQGNGSDSALIACLEFARTNGAHIINASLDSPAFSQALSNAVQRASEDGVILVASCGNNTANVDLSPRYPACYAISNIVSVAYTTRSDALGSLSNYGATNVDLAAPGAAMYSTFFASDSSYLGNTALAGSSLAAPFVSGAAALLRARYPFDSAAQTVDRILRTTDPLPGLANRCVTGGRLNLRRALQSSVALTPLTVGAAPPFRIRVTGEPGSVWVIQSSPDLEIWSPRLTNTVPASGSFEFEDVEPEAIHRYYRAAAK